MRFPVAFLLATAIFAGVRADDFIGYIGSPCDRLTEDGCDSWEKTTDSFFVTSDRLSVVPSMFGDGFFKPSGPIQGQRLIDRLMVVANDLDAPTPLPAGALTITEAGPIGVFDTSLGSIQEIQQLLRAAQPLPAATLAGTLPDSATLTTSATVAAIQNQLAASGQPHEIIGLIEPPAGYAAGVDALFVTRNGAVGAVVFNQAGSGAIIQGGDTTLDAGDDLDAFYFYDYVLGFQVDSPFAASLRTGTIKIANGGTPLPQTRFIMDYSVFTDVEFVSQGATVNRFVTGYERAFADGLFSIEMRLPFSSTTSDDFSANATGVSADRDVSFGNITSFFKALLYRTDDFALSAGMSLSLPTASSVRVGTDTDPLVHIANDAVHLGPFAGWMYSPSDRWFTQGFLQFDFATTGNEVRFDTDGNGLQTAGKLNDSSYVFADAGVGYWIAPHGKYARPTALMAELHYNSSISDSDFVRSGNFQVGSANNSVDALNLTTGFSTQIKPNMLLSAAYIAPLTNGNETPGGGGQIRLEYRP